MRRGVGDLVGRWLRGWTLWIGALVGAALFAGAMSGMAYVRNSYEPPVDYPALNDAELDAAKARSSSTAAAPAQKKHRLEAPATTQPDPTPTVSPRKVSPKKATNDPASAEPSESGGSAESSESPAGPLAGLEKLFSGGERR